MSKLSDTVICVPTYKNRFSHIVGNLKNIDSKYDIVVFTNGNDYVESGYDKYDWDAPNITVVNTNCNNIFEKRQLMLDYVIEQGYKGMFQVDDDVMFEGKKITPESKRTTSDSYHGIKISFNELIDKVKEVTIAEDAAFGSPMFIFSLGFSKPGKINVNSGINFGQLTYMNVDKIKESGIKYDTSGMIHEDVDFVFELIRHGYKCITLGDYAFQPDGKAMYAGTTASLTCNLMDQVNLRAGMYLKYRDGITLVYNKNGLITMRCNLKKYWNTLEIPVKNDPYHIGLYEICKTRDSEKIKEYLKQAKEHK